MESINKTLLALQDEWIRCIADPFVQNEPNERFSKSFHLGLSDKLSSDRKLVMLIGQEASDFWTYESKEYTTSKIQQWCIDYFDKQLFLSANDKRYNRSHFWNFFRNIHKSGFDVCWNNLDKLHCYESALSENGSIVQRTIRLKPGYELELSQQYGPDNKSLLQREIDVVKSHAIVFLTGPDYVDSMACAFGINPRTLAPLKPNKENLLQRIEHVIGLDTPVFWTYHPNYLHFKTGYTAKVVNSLIDRLT